MVHLLEVLGLDLIWDLVFLGVDEPSDAHTRPGCHVGQRSSRCYLLAKIVENKRQLTVDDVIGALRDTTCSIMQGPSQEMSSSLDVRGRQRDFKGPVVQPESLAARGQRMVVLKLFRGRVKGRVGEGDKRNQQRRKW